MRIATGASVALLCLAVLTGASTASAQVCDEPTQEQLALSYLRRLSLDLRGRVPDLAEVEAVVAAGQVDPALIDEMLASDDFLHQTRRYHLDLLWTNLSRQRLSLFSWVLSAPAGRQRAPAYWMPAQSRAGLFRGVQEPCLDQPAEFARDGSIVTYPDAVRPGVRKEGWVEVAPYWAPDSPVRVCAFDAQSNLTTPNVRNPNGPPFNCATSVNQPGCGCGPNLQWCQTNTGQGDTTRLITNAMTEQMLRLLDRIVAEDRPYTDVLLATDTEVNGPLSHYLRHQTLTGGNQFLASPAQGYDVPEVGFAEADTWVQVERGERHSGVLTLPGYLVRFQTDRSRANRFYNAFLCDHFQAPEGGLPAASDDCNSEPDLTKRCGCKNCHLTLEPAAAYWGRYAEAGLGSLEEVSFPKFRQDCVVEEGRRASALCQSFYLTRANHRDEEPWVGTLLPYVFGDEDREARIAQGPAGIAHDAIDSGRFAQCTVDKLFVALANRPFGESEASLRDGLIADFVASNYSLRELAFGIVSTAAYRDAGRVGEVAP